MTLRIVVVEREPLRCAGLERLLSTTTGMDVLGCAHSVREAVHLPALKPADVVLAGADLPDMDGTAGIGALLARFNCAQVVLLGPGSDPGFLIAAFRAGADGYLTRNITSNGLIRALRGIEQGEVALPRNLTHLLVEAVRYSAPAGAAESSIDRLSPREREVLREISRGRSNLEIADVLCVSESTVKTHVSSILRKTGSRSRFLLQAVGEG